MLFTLSSIATTAGITEILAGLGNIILFLFVLGLVICIHELGHYMFAKKAGILCHEFAFGMGPRIWSKKKGETIFSIRAIPFGGFVSMAGEELEAEILKVGQKIRLGFNKKNEVNRIIIKSTDPNYQDFLEVTIEDFDISSIEGNRLFINEHTVNRKAKYVLGKNHIQIAPKDRSFSYKTKRERFLVTFGGPLMNFILALFVFLIMSLIAGVPDPDSTVISDVSDGAPAYGLLYSGDEIKSINGVSVDSWTAESNSVQSELNKTHESYIIVVDRDGAEETVTLSPQLLFYGLGFVSVAGSEELIISSPVYIKSELLAGDEIISFNGVELTTWDDVIATAYANTEGSIDKKDLFDITVFRKATALINGTVDNMYLDPLDVSYSYIKVLVDDTTNEYVEYRYQTAETVLVEIGDSIETGDILTTGAEYTFSFIMYGEDILDDIGGSIFSTRIGIAGSTNFSFFGSFPLALKAFWAAATTIFSTLGLLFSSPLITVSDLSGFVGIFSMTSSAAAAGLISLLSWIGLLSVNLGVVNLLPIPALDGGRLVFIGYETIVGRKPNQKVENLLHTIMFFLLMGLLIFITYNDIANLFR
ncbi:MAG: site-2 protease family protein [Tenericutes bacterium]|nr:site-2 protease family protein [Mycoplasmatota bacterium]